MKHINIVIIDGVERDIATLSAEEREKIVNELNRVAVGYLGYQKEKLFTEGVVQNTDGTIAYNLMQNDMVALRAVMRMGWEVPNPINALAKDKTKRCPFSILKAGE